MQTPLKLLLVAVSMSACFAHAAETTDPLGPMPGEAATTSTPSIESEPAASKKTVPAPAQALAKPPATATTAPVATSAPAASFTAELVVPAQASAKPPATTPVAEENAAAPSFAAKPVGPVADATPTPASAKTTIVVPAPERTFTRTSNATFLELDRLRSQNAVLVEMVRRKELEAKLTPPTPAAVSPTHNSGITANAGMNIATGIHPNMVLSIYGIEDDVTAVLSTTSAPLKVKVGSHVPGLGQVKSISREGVTVSTKKSTVTLEMAPISAYPGAR